MYSILLIFLCLLEYLLPHRLSVKFFQFIYAWSSMRNIVWIFVKFEDWIWRLVTLQITDELRNFSFRSDTSKISLYEDLYEHLCISRAWVATYLLEWKMFWTKVLEKMKLIFCVTYTFSTCFWDKWTNLASYMYTTLNFFVQPLVWSLVTFKTWFTTGIWRSNSVVECFTFHA